MSTNSNRSAGTQHTKKGVVKGEVLVDPVSGEPINVVQGNDGKRRLAVDANLNAEDLQVDVQLDYDSDSIAIGDPTTDAILKINPDGSIDANVELDSADGDNVAIKDSNGNELLINPDGSINVSDSSSNTPVIANVTAIAANTEYSYSFPANTKKFSFRTRTNAKLNFSFTSGQTSLNYMTLFPGSVYQETGLNTSSLTLYFMSSKAGETIEILSWN